MNSSYCGWIKSFSIKAKMNDYIGEVSLDILLKVSSNPNHARRLTRPQMTSQDEKRKREDRERKKAEVRARLEAAAASKKKKGFMTPERKKKLKLLLRRKAAEELKRQQEVKAGERKKVITQRTGEKKNLDSLSDGKL